MKAHVMRLRCASIVAAILLVGPMAPVFAADSGDADTAAKARSTLDKAIQYLKAQQKDNGGWGTEKDPPALTALVLKAVVVGRPQDKQEGYVRKGYQNLLSNQLANGGIYRDLLANYNTAIAVSALAAADDPQYRDRIDRAVAYLKGLQLTDQTRPEYSGPKEQFTGKQFIKDDKDPFYGGWGYGGARSQGVGRPDLSNVQVTLDALHDAGLKPGDPAYDRAVKFVTRLQNLSETNDQPWAGDDGGFVYSPADTRRGDSMAGEYTGPDGRRMLRSYGSMTYAGLKSMIYAGLTKDDPRVKAAWDWIRKNWSVDENPGMRLNNPDAARNGLYYYYHTMARALNAYDEPTIVDAQGKKHDWRAELVDKLASLQRPDGSFAGEKRFMEDNPVLVTAYTAIALAETLQDLNEHPAQ